MPSKAPAKLPRSNSTLNPHPSQPSYRSDLSEFPSITYSVKPHSPCNELNWTLNVHVCNLIRSRMVGKIRMGKLLFCPPIFFSHFSHLRTLRTLALSHFATHLPPPSINLYAPSKYHFDPHHTHDRFAQQKYRHLKPPASPATN